METETEEGWWSRQFNRLEQRWNNLSMLQQRMVTLAAIALLETLLAYCCWVAETRGQSASVVHIGILRVAAITGVFVCAFPNALLILRLIEKASTRLRAFGKRLTTPLQRTASRVTQHIPPLTQAHGFYTVGRDAEARTLAEQALAQEPENVTAQELIQLLDARQAHNTFELEEKPGLTDKVLDGITEKIVCSTYTPVVAIVLAIVSAILSLFHCVRYIIMGVTQGWNTTTWTAFDRGRNLTFIPVWNVVLLAAIWPTLVSVGILRIYFPDHLDKLLHIGAKPCHAIFDWGKSRLSAIRSFASRMVRSTPSRFSEPKASPASRPSSTTRTRPRK